MTGAALISAARVAARLRERLPGNLKPEVDGTLCEDGATVLLTVGYHGQTLAENIALESLGGAPVADFAQHIEASLHRPRRPILKLRP